MAVSIYDKFVIGKGVTFSDILTAKEYIDGPLVDLTGKTALMVIRQNYNEASDVYLTMTTENGMIELGGTDGTIELTIPADVTADLTFEQAVYSLFLMEGATVEHFLKGNIALDDTGYPV